LCLRLPDGVVGIDVDAYGTKTGAATLAEAEQRWGPLPCTVRSTSREDGVSGIKLYRVPAGTKLAGGIKFSELGIADIDVIQTDHRYVNCAPTIHPEGRTYKWIDERTQAEVALPPAPDDLPELPAPWLEGMRNDAPRSKAEREQRACAERRTAPRQALYDVSEAMTGGRPSPRVAERLSKALYDLTQGASRHDTMLGHVLALLRLGQAGQPGVGLALSTLSPLFVAEVGPDRPGGEAEAEAEFARMITNADRLLTDPGATVEEGVDEAAREFAAFWAQRPILSHIQGFAAVRRANPYAVLGAVLRRAIALVPPSVQLPPIVGDRASLNLFTASVGKSGQGKDVANGVGAAAVQFLGPDGGILEDAPSPGIGSGEGLARFFHGHGKAKGSGDGEDGDDDKHVAAHILVNEIGTLAALAARKGGTLVGELLKAFTGQSLGFTNAQRATTTHVAAHSYRLCISISAQPENVDFFLDREKDGLPQRFLWLPVVNPFAHPPGGEPPQRVPELEVVIPTFHTLAGLPFEVEVPQSVRSTILQFRYLVEIGSDEVDPLDGHLMLLRLKVAFGLAVLEERREITEDDWRVAGQLLDVSNAVRADMARVVQDSRRRVNTARAHAEADRQEIIGDRTVESTQRRVEKAIRTRLSKGRATKRQLTKSCTYAIRRDFEPVFERLLEDNVILRCGEGDEYELAGG